MNPDQMRKIIAANVRAERARKGLTQSQVAEQMEACGHVMHFTRLSKIERGNRDISAVEMVALAAVLGVAPARLLP